MYSNSPASDKRNDALPMWKRALDIAFCLAALPFLAVAALWAFLLTRIFSPGPVFFRQERVGYQGRKFALYKFRSMHVSANVMTHQVHFAQLMRSNVPMQKLDARGDARLIPGGWLLRASGLDELPQIINVLRGEMSIVGPRPCLPYEYEQYSAWQRNRLTAVPGLTGLWQVSGKNRTTFDEMVQLDIAYAKSLSFQQDLGIMLRTLPALLVQIGDTRRARGTQQSLPQAQATESAGADATSVSATFSSRSQNLIVNTVEKHRPFAPRQVRDACISVESRQ